MNRRQFLLTTASTTAIAAAPVLQSVSSPVNPTTQSASMTVENDGARLYVETTGTGTPILLLHGGLGHMGWFSEVRSQLASRYRVVLMDSRGCGRSTLGNRLSYGQQERDVLAVLDRLKIRQCPVIGFSDGGIVGMRLAAREDSPVSRLVTIGSRWRARHGQAMWREFDRWSRKTLSSGDFKFIVEDYDRLNPDRNFDRLLRLSVAMWKDDSAEGHPGDRVDRIKVPVLITVGDRDPFMSVNSCAELRQRIARSELFVIPGGTHPAYRERPDLFLPALDRFLSA